MLKELLEKRDKLVADARAALDEIKKNTDDARTAELEARHDAIMTEFDTVENQIKREERVIAAERSLEERQQRRRPIGPDSEQRSSDEPGGDALEYRSVFHKFLAAGGDPSDLSREERDVLRSGFVQAEKEQRAQGTGAGPTGGYTVPTELATFIDKAMKDWGPMYDEDICTVLNTSSGNPIPIPTVDDTDKDADARDENDDLVDDGSGDVEFGQAVLNAYVAATPWIRWSFELASDSIFNVEQLLGTLVGERLGRKGNRWLTSGTGVDQPKGIVTAASLGVTTAATAAITPEELIDFQHSVNQAYRRSPKCRWMFADSTLKALRKLKDGEGRFVWQPSDMKTGAPATFLDKPYSINDDVPAIAAGARAMLFGDFGRFYVRKVGSPMIGVVRERFWPNLGIAGLIRLDGEIGQSGAIKALRLAAA